MPLPKDWFISFIKRKILRLSRDRWNHQYARGRWNGLDGEEDRFQAVIRMIRSGPSQPRILEIGCGDATLLRKMEPGSFASFTGVDISDIAIESAQSLAGNNIRFEAGDMHSWTPEGVFDLIIFNESLYYARQPARLLKRFEPYLSPNGFFIITAVQNKYTENFWAPLEQVYRKGRQEEVCNQHHTWKVRQLWPSSYQGNAQGPVVNS